MTQFYLEIGPGQEPRRQASSNGVSRACWVVVQHYKPRVILVWGYSLGLRLY